MALKISKPLAKEILHREAESAQLSQDVDDEWHQKILRLSELCEMPGSSRTHIAFLGTLILAKAVDSRVDLYAIKPNHAVDNPNAFSARVLCHSVLVPLSAELGFSIGVTGREPLNNQPYFRMTRLDDGTPVHSGAKAAFDYMLGLVQELQQIEDEDAAKPILRSFIAVRREFQPSYADNADGLQVTPDGLLQAIETFVGENSEGGRRAQAVVAALMDVVVGEDRVESGRINDPSRKHPGDVCVHHPSSNEGWEKAVEVRDKPVSLSDILVFGRKCIAMSVQEAAVAAVSGQQPVFDNAALTKWSNEFGIGITVFLGWEAFVQQSLFWAPEPKPIGATVAVEQIRRRLVAVEASPGSVNRWLEIVTDLTK